MATVLILGGTREARELAEGLADAPDLAPILSLAGVTDAPAPRGAEIRRGGFGGAPGLSRFLKERRVSAVIDATHPFAARITANAAQAAKAAQTPLLRLERPGWSPRPQERWIETDSLKAAADMPPPGARLLLTIGPQSAAAFAGRPDLWCALRRIEPTTEPFPLPTGEWVFGRPSDSAKQERRLMTSLKVDWLVTKNSGGARAKIDAAAALGLRVLVINRPLSPPGLRRVETTAAALAWVRAYAL